MTVEDNLLMGAYRRTNTVEIARDMDRMLFPRLGERRKQLAGSMSGGEQQMCAMARALMARPLLLMIDEMSLVLAPVVVQQLTDVLAEIRGQGVTFLLVEQDVQLRFPWPIAAVLWKPALWSTAGPAKMLVSDPAVRQAYLGL
jgi:branched-chain amino acid transport system ATP-binding protein